MQKEPPATMELGLCPAAFMMYLVRPADDSDYTVTDCGSHVKRALTRSDCTDLDTGFFFLGRGGHGEMLRVRGSFADLSSASRTCAR